MKKNKVLYAISAIAISSLLLVGCGGKKETPKELEKQEPKGSPLGYMHEDEDKIIMFRFSTNPKTLIKEYEADKSKTKETKKPLKGKIEINQFINNQISTDMVDFEGEFDVKNKKIALVVQESAVLSKTLGKITAGSLEKDTLKISYIESFQNNNETLTSGENKKISLDFVTDVAYDNAKNKKEKEKKTTYEKNVEKDAKQLQPLLTQTKEELENIQKQGNKLWSDVDSHINALKTKTKTFQSSFYNSNKPSKNPNALLAQARTDYENILTQKKRLEDKVLLLNNTIEQTKRLQQNIDMLSAFYNGSATYVKNNEEVATTKKDISYITLTYSNLKLKFETQVNTANEEINKNLAVATELYGQL